MKLDYAKPIAEALAFAKSAAALDGRPRIARMVAAAQAGFEKHLKEAKVELPELDRETNPYREAARAMREEGVAQAKWYEVPSNE